MSLYVKALRHKKRPRYPDAGGAEAALRARACGKLGVTAYPGVLTASLLKWRWGRAEGRASLQEERTAPARSVGLLVMYTAGAQHIVILPQACYRSWRRRMASSTSGFLSQVCCLSDESTLESCREPVTNSTLVLMQAPLCSTWSPSMARTTS